MKREHPICPQCGKRHSRGVPCSYYKTEPPSEIIIERDYYTWCIRNGSHLTPIPFPWAIDPLTVAKALKAKAQGPLNIIVNL